MIAGIVAGAPVSGGGGSGHRWWRVLISEAQTGTPSYIGATEITLHETVGGPNIALSNVGVITSGAVNSDNSADRAFDNNFVNSGWLDTFPHLPNVYAGVEFATEKDIAQFGITASFNYPDGNPKNFKLQWSDNGSAWTDAKTVTGETGWGAIETRLYTV